jgi:hypothetical protein
MKFTETNPLKPTGKLYIPPALAIINSEFWPRTVCGVRMVLRIISDYFSKQYKPADACNGDGLCFL